MKLSISTLGSIHWKRLNFGPLPWSLEIVGLDIRAENGESVISADGLRIGQLTSLGLSQVIFISES